MKELNGNPGREAKKLTLSLYVALELVGTNALEMEFSGVGGRENGFLSCKKSYGIFGRDANPIDVIDSRQHTGTLAGVISFSCILACSLGEHTSC